MTSEGGAGWGEHRGFSEPDFLPFLWLVQKFPFEDESSRRKKA